MWRKSLSCMAAGTMILVPLWLLEVFGCDWQPRKVAVIAIFYVSIVGVAWLYDETRGARRG
jgi:hypothetical protein